MNEAKPSVTEEYIRVSNALIDAQEHMVQELKSHISSLNAEIERLTKLTQAQSSLIEALNKQKSLLESMLGTVVLFQTQHFGLDICVCLC